MILFSKTLFVDVPRKRALCLERKWGGEFLKFVKRYMMELMKGWCRTYNLSGHSHQRVKHVAPEETARCCSKVNNTVWTRSAISFNQGLPLIDVWPMPCLLPSPHINPTSLNKMQFWSVDLCCHTVCSSNSSRIWKITTTKCHFAFLALDIL